MNLFAKMAMEGIDATFGIMNTMGTIEDAGNVLKDFFSDEGVSAQAFLDMYNLRSYNFANKQQDIKIMKNFDFEGIYVIYNKKWDLYYVGKGKKVFHKIERHFNGYGNKEIYTCWKRNEEFLVHGIRLDKSGYDNLDLLARDTVENYDGLLI